jgi:hypothetical protein
MRHVFPVLAAAAILACGAVQADQGNSQGKGKGHGQGNAQSQDQPYYGDYGQGKGKDDYKGNDNHGQATSDCNHMANQRKLKGQERKNYVEWCQDRGQHWGYKDNSWYGEKTCYQKADNKGLSGDKRRRFLQDCFDKKR